VSKESVVCLDEIIKIRNGPLVFYGCFYLNTPLKTCQMLSKMSTSVTLKQLLSIIKAFNFHKIIEADIPG